MGNGSWAPGEKLRIGAAVYGVHVTDCGVAERTLTRTPSCSLPGISHQVAGRRWGLGWADWACPLQILSMVLEMAGIDYEIVPYDAERDWGLRIPGGGPCAWTGILGWLAQEGKVWEWARLSRGHL